MKPEKDTTYWRRKLDAYMHDSPDKALDIIGHEARAEELKKIDAIAWDEAFQKRTDFAASAADRLPMPHFRKSGLKSNFRGDEDSPFKHPLGGASIHFNRTFRTVEEALEGSFKSRPVIKEEDPRLAFIARWRFWSNWASDIQPLFGYMPADTRIPDHTIWNHMQVTSAMQGCVDRDGRLCPAFLLFSVGPVQDFIAAARSTRDLWSGSYLLSYLVASVLAEVSTTIGPDHVIFPNLRNQPLMDMMLKPLWASVHTHDGRSLWEAFRYLDTEAGRQRLLTPSLPNRFLLLVNKEEAKTIATWIESLIRDRLGAIAESVATTAERLNEERDAFNRERFLRQIAALPEVFWQVYEWPDNFRGARELYEMVVPAAAREVESALSTVQAVAEAVPEDERDGHIVSAGTPTQAAAAWPALFSTCQALHDGLKQTRLFDAWDSASGWRYGRDENKDSLNGREEVVLTVDNSEEHADELRQLLGQGWEKTTFRAGERIGGSTLLKRLWHRAWLSREHDFDPDSGDFAMPDTHSIAKGEAFNDDRFTREENADSDSSAGYYAILALDGDEMGKWIAGAKMPKLGDQVAREVQTYFQQKGKGEVLDRARPLNPSFHLHFSEMLANFSLYCVRPIVEAHRGRLLYAGGDDVLAMLPADTALDCAYALRQAFRGDNAWLAENVAGMWSGVQRKRYNAGIPIFDTDWKVMGTIKLNVASAIEDETMPLVSDPWHFPALVPGPSADCSVGIAIGHALAPLQDMVKAAQAAEKRAKRSPEDGGFGRSALAISIFKRSGEILEWGLGWPESSSNETGLFLFQKLLTGMSSGLSSRFPYRVVEFLTQYLGKTDSVEDDAEFAQSLKDILVRDFEDVLQSQGSTAGASFRLDLLNAYHAYLEHLQKNHSGNRRLNHLLEQVIGLFRTLAWVAKNKHKDKEE